MIDAHQHFWKYDPVNYSWIDENMQAIRQDFLPENLGKLLHYHGFKGSVLIQVNQDEAENEWFLKLAEENAFIKGIVGWVNLKAANLDERLNYYHQKPAIKGFRHIVQAEPDDFLLNTEFVQGVEKLKNFDFTYDILIFERQLKSALHFIRKLPENKLIIDHIAKPDIKNKSLSRWSNYMKEIARQENVLVKISGMVTETSYHNWQKEDFFIYLDHVLNCFGTKRILYGSDWPVCLVSATYEEQLDIIESYFDQLSQTEKADIFGENAKRFYNLY